MIILIQLLRYNKVITYEARNHFAELFLPASKRPGFKAGHILEIPALIIKRIGILESKHQEIEWFNHLIERFKFENIKYILFENDIPFSPSNDELKNIRSNFCKIDYETNFLELSTCLLKTLTYWNDLNFGNRHDSLKFALSSVLFDFHKNTTNYNESKLINFAAKLLYWLEHFCKDILTSSDFLDIDTISSKNPKLIYSGQISEHESYFILLLYYMGFDIIYLNPSLDLISTKNKTLSQLGSSITLNLTLDLLDYLPRKKEEIKSNVVSSKPQEVTPIEKPKPAKVLISQINEAINIKKKSFSGDLNEFFIPIKERLGIDNQPTLFVRYIGIDKNKTQYNNRLFQFESLCQKNTKLFKKYENKIPILSSTHLIDKTISLWNESAIGEPLDLIGKLKTLGLFDFIKDGELLEQSYYALYQITSMICEDDPNITLSKLKNLIIKLASWFESLYKDDFSSYRYAFPHNPVVMFYGEIKAHEALFLLFLRMIGIDILYIHTYEDTVFGEIDPDEEFSIQFILESVSPLVDFPQSLLLERVETVSYRASQEISDVIFNDEDGIYKPWQFENYKTLNTTLKTTYEELLILWNEETRLRSGFKVVNDTLYIPNLFAKISGTQENINDYWKDVKKLTSSSLTLFYKSIPIHPQTYYERDLDQISSLISKEGGLLHDSILRYQEYKYQYLPQALQEKICNSIDMLMNYDIMTYHSDNIFKQKIIKTVLNLDPRIIQLIQKFDYPFKSPKIVIYHHIENPMTDEDSIVIAFCFLMGFDICILTPSGYNNIETHIKLDFFDIHKQAQKQFKLDLVNLNRINLERPKGFWANLLG